MHIRFNSCPPQHLVWTDFGVPNAWYTPTGSLIPVAWCHGEQVLVSLAHPLSPPPTLSHFPSLAAFVIKKIHTRVMLFSLRMHADLSADAVYATVHMEQTKA